MYAAAVTQKSRAAIGSSNARQCSAALSELGLTVYSIIVTITLRFVDDEADSNYISFSIEGWDGAKK